MANRAMAKPPWYIMSPERYDFLIHSAERGHMWREAIRAHKGRRAGNTCERSDPRPD